MKRSTWIEGALYIVYLGVGLGIAWVVVKFLQAVAG